MDLAVAKCRFAGMLPMVTELDGIVIGSHVLLGLETGAKFWAQVIEVRTNGFMGQAFDNLPGCPVKIGDQCFFDRSNIFRIV